MLPSAVTAGNTICVESTFPLKAALVLKVAFIELLPIASCPFLTPIAESALRKFATFFYADEKAKETNSNPSYVSSSAKKLGIVLWPCQKYKRARVSRLSVTN